MKSRSLIESFNYAVSGIIYTLKTERNMRIHFVISIIVILLSLFFLIFQGGENFYCSFFYYIIGIYH